MKTALPLRLELPKLGGGAGTSRATAPAATGTSAALAAAVAAPPVPLSIPQLASGCGAARTAGKALWGPHSAALMPQGCARDLAVGLEDFGADDEDDDGTETMLLQAITSFFSKREEAGDLQYSALNARSSVARQYWGSTMAVQCMWVWVCVSRRRTRPSEHSSSTTPSPRSRQMQRCAASLCTRHHSYRQRTGRRHHACRAHRASRSAGLLHLCAPLVMFVCAGCDGCAR